VYFYTFKIPVMGMDQTSVE